MNRQKIAQSAVRLLGGTGYAASALAVSVLLIGVCLAGVLLAAAADSWWENFEPRETVVQAIAQSKEVIKLERFMELVMEDLAKENGISPTEGF